MIGMETLAPLAPSNMHLKGVCLYHKLYGDSLVSISAKAETGVRYWMEHETSLNIGGSPVRVWDVRWIDY